MEDTELVKLLCVKEKIKLIEKETEKLVVTLDFFERIKNDKEISNIKLYLSCIDFAIDELIFKLQNKG